MSDTAGKPNGEAAESMLNLVPESSYITGQREAPSARHVFVSKPLLTEHIDPQDLYRVFSPEEKGFVVDAPIARISQSVAECLPHIVQAINEADELQRENHYLWRYPTFSPWRVSPEYQRTLTMHSHCCWARWLHTGRPPTREMNCWRSSGPSKS